MQFIIEDRKKLQHFFNLLKSLISVQSSCHILVQKQGWYIMQNSELLENLDNKELISFTHLPSTFFQQIYVEDIVSNNQQAHFQNCNSDSNQETFAFEIDVAKMFKTIKPVKYSLKKLTFQIEKLQNNLRFMVLVQTDEGMLQYQKDVYNDDTLALKYGLYSQFLENFDEGKTEYISIEGKYLRQLREMKNMYTELKFNNYFMNISCPNQPQEQQINIQNEIFNNYDYESLQASIDGSLLIPPNYLDSHIFMSNKISQGSSPMQIYLQTTNIQNKFILYAKTQSDSITIFHSFVTTSQQYDPVQPQIQQQQQSVPNTFQNKIHNKLQQQSQNEKQKNNFNRILPNDINSDVNYFQVPSSSESSQDVTFSKPQLQQQQQQQEIEVESQKRPKFKLSQKQKANQGFQLTRKYKSNDVIIAPSTQLQKEVLGDDFKSNQKETDTNQKGFQIPKGKGIDQLNMTENSNLINSFNSTSSFFHPNNQQQLFASPLKQQYNQQPQQQHMYEQPQQQLSFDSVDVNEYLNFMQFIKIQKQQQKRPKNELLEFMKSNNNSGTKNYQSSSNLFNRANNQDYSHQFYQQNKNLITKNRQKLNQFY